MSILIENKNILKNILVVTIILILTSCNLIRFRKSSPAIAKSKTIFHSKYISTDSNGVVFYLCEDFVSNALNNYSIATINKEFINIVKCSKEAIANNHDKKVIDTIYSFSNSENKIQIYRARQNDFIFTFDVRDPRLKLVGNIYSGMTKEEFSKKLSITQVINNKIQIVNTQGSIRFMFYFENDQLKRISSYLYLD